LLRLNLAGLSTGKHHVSDIGGSGIDLICWRVASSIAARCFALNPAADNPTIITFDVF
jgi:hypothetical protein